MAARRKAPSLLDAIPAGVEPARELEIVRVPTDRLLLDPENPRLETVDREGDTQIQLLKALWRSMAVDELALSIAANGFFPEEPLFVVRAAPEGKNGDDRYVVVEGNRRLAAVKLMIDADLRAKIKAADLPAISESRAMQLRELPVSIHESRKSLWEYFGFRHVNGPKQWDSYSKAAYIARVKREYGIPLEEIAYRIGDRNRTVERLFLGYAILEQAERATLYDPEDRYRKRLAISHLYTAVDYAEVADYLGLDLDATPEADPVPKKNLPRLRELLLWIYGSRSEGVEPLVRSQNPHVRLLAETIGNPDGLRALRAGMPLERAHATARGDTRRFDESLAAAKDALQEARGTVTTGYKGTEEALERIEEILKLARRIEKEMREIREADDEEPIRKESRRARAVSR